MIMGKKSTERLMTLPELAEMLGVPIETLYGAMPEKYKAMVLVGAYAGLRWGEAAGLTRASIDVLRSRITVASTAVEVRGLVTLGHEPKTSRSKRTVRRGR
jgi:integrase